MENNFLPALFLSLLGTSIITTLFPFRKQVIIVTKKGKVKTSILGRRIFRWRKYYTADIQPMSFEIPLHETTVSSLYSDVTGVIMHNYNCSIMLDCKIIEKAYQAIDYSNIAPRSKVDFGFSLQEKLCKLILEALIEQKVQNEDVLKHDSMASILDYLRTMSVDRNYARIEEKFKKYFNHETPIIAFASFEGIGEKSKTS